MLNRCKSFLGSLDRRYRILVAATGVYSWAMTLSATYAQLYAALLGANPLELGGLSSVSNVAGALAAIPVGWLMTVYGLKRTLLAGFAAFIASALNYALATHWYALVPATLLSALAPALIFPVSDIIIVDVSGRGSRATAIGVSRAVWNLFSLAAPPIATLVVAVSGGIVVEGIRPLFLIQFAAALAAALLLLFKLEDLKPATNEGSRRPGVVGVIRDLKPLLSTRGSAAWMAAMAMQRFSMALSFSFLPLWLVAVRGANEYLIGAMNTAGLAALIIASAPAGALADRQGWLKVFLALRSLLYAGTLTALAFDHPLALVAAGCLGLPGFMFGAGSASFIPFITAFWEASPPERRGAWYAASSLLGGFVATAAPIVGGVLWELGHQDAILLLPLAIDGAGLVLTVAAAKWSQRTQ